ncbi:MAG: amine oxidase [Verrucomicrobia bacterium 21-51-4]|nr:MAG: amine oxidase [Verrucomicrobia bacterium 21-51-4]HQU08484.1 NAD(P)/FAD-dependent oxidoreductase [Opitutales bacterium]
MPHPKAHITIVGAGFTGLSAAWKLLQQGHKVTIIESDTMVGGLAGGFYIGGSEIEKFYHHWFTNDTYALDLVHELGLSDKLHLHTSRTGLYYANTIFRLSRPLDVLKFKPLKFIDRIRLGLLVPQVRAVKDWRKLEGLTAREWLLKACGPEVFRVVWEPLLKGKFGPYADQISAVWFWNKLKLRGSSRGQKGNEQLAYLQGGFMTLAQSLAKQIEELGGIILLNTKVERLLMSDNTLQGIQTDHGIVDCDAALLTPALPIIPPWLEPHCDLAYITRLKSIRYLANVCLILSLDRSLSSTYWLNVNDPTFPFVGIIEHTNFESPQTYNGQHIVYLSKYLPQTDAMYQMSSEELLEYALPHIQRMFPNFERSWVRNHWLWKAQYSQPIVDCHYSKRIPSVQSPIPNLFVSNMAQIYPEDRGTNYAIRGGYQAAELMNNALEAIMQRPLQIV